MTGAELAAMTGLSEATISRLASGERKPSFETMEKVRMALGWSIQRQVDEVRCGSYAADFKSRMERRRGRTRT